VLEKIVSSFNLLMASGGALIESEKLSAEYSLSEYESHRELYEALRTRDPDHAQQVMEAHVMATHDALKEISNHKLEK